MMKKSRVFLITFMALAVFLFLNCSKKKSTEPESSKDKWTILGYFDGNNLDDLDKLEKSCVIRDVQEMEQVGSTEDVRIIVMLGSIKTQGSCNYYFIEKYLSEPSDSIISSQVLVSLGKKDMSDPQTLWNFINYGVEHYPADHYMLIINGDGSGWRGVCSDSFFQNVDGGMMTLPELSSVLSDNNFEIILFNAPSMSMLEVAYQLKTKADYLVASQWNKFMRNILGFPIWLQSLANNPGISSRDLARNIAAAMHTTAVSKGGKTSISAVDLSKMDTLTSKVAEFGSALVTYTGDHWKEVVDAREVSPSSPIYLYHFDLKKFCQDIQDASTDLDSTIKSNARAVGNVIDDAVVEVLSTPDSGYGGLCIHFPINSSNFDSINYVQLDFTASNWHIFLSRFVQAYGEINSGSLRIVSEPSKGAWIFLDGDSTGLVTDTTIHGITEGEHNVTLAKGACRWSGPPVTVVIKTGQTTERVIGFLCPSSEKESIYDISER
jgi:hypothetical protein